MSLLAGLKKKTSSKKRTHGLSRKVQYFISVAEISSTTGIEALLAEISGKHLADLSYFSELVKCANSNIESNSLRLKKLFSELSIDLAF